MTRSDVVVLKFTEKLTKKISETAYLTEENSNRYRPIMRYFYNKYEQAENWIYKEDVYDFLKDYIPDYTIEECQRDLDFLVAKLSLTTVQDTENANTLEKFKFKNYRYQMTDYAIEIERMTIRLEEMEVKVASLEPRLFERIYLLLQKLVDIKARDEASLYELWGDLTTDFTNLNQSYQDFLKKFHEPKTEELLQSVLFIEHKNNLISYLQNFIKEYLVNNTKIKDVILSIPAENVDLFMDSIISHQKKAPKINPNFDFDHLREVNLGKWNSLKRWFIKENGLSEGERLLQATNNIISKITKYASNLIELHGNMVNRKEEYKYLCKLFDNEVDIEDAHNLAGSILGVQTVRHYKGVSNLESDSIVYSYDVPPTNIVVDPVKRGIKSTGEKAAIKDKTLEKERVLREYQEEEERNRKILNNLTKDGQIRLIDEINLSKEERKYIFTLIDKAQSKIKIDPVFGYTYSIKEVEGKCKIVSPDGIFEMPSLTINFGGDSRG